MKLEIGDIVKFKGNGHYGNMPKTFKIIEVIKPIGMNTSGWLVRTNTDPSKWDSSHLELVERPLKETFYK